MASHAKGDIRPDINRAAVNGQRERVVGPKYSCDWVAACESLHSAAVEWTCCLVLCAKEEILLIYKSN